MTDPRDEVAVAAELTRIAPAERVPYLNRWVAAIEATVDVPAGHDRDSYLAGYTERSLIVLAAILAGTSGRANLELIG